MSNPLFENKVLAQKHHREVDKCRNSISYINHIILNNFKFIYVEYISNGIRNETNIIMYVIICDEQKLIWFECEVLSMRLMSFMRAECSFLFEVDGGNIVEK